MSFVNISSAIMMWARCPWNGVHSTTISILVSDKWLRRNYGSSNAATLPSKHRLFLPSFACATGEDENPLEHAVRKNPAPLLIPQFLVIFVSGTKWNSRESNFFKMKLKDGTYSLTISLNFVSNGVCISIWWCLNSCSHSDTTPCLESTSQLGRNIQAP